MSQLELPGLWHKGGLREATQWFLLNALGEVSYWTRRMHEDNCKYVLEYFGDINLQLLTYQKLMDYVGHEKVRISKESIRKRLSSLHRVMDEAHKRGLIDRIPPWPRIKSDSRPKEDFWTLPEYRVVRLTEEDEDFRAWLDIAFWCGSHTSDIYRFRWSDIDWHTKTWIRRNTKCKTRPFPLPLPDELHKYLWERWDRFRPHARDMVCGKNFGHPNRRLRDLAVEAQVPIISPIGLRRSCGTYLAEKGATEDFQRLWFGHAADSVIIRRHYRRPTTPVIEAGMAAINRR